MPICILATSWPCRVTRSVLSTLVSVIILTQPYARGNCAIFLPLIAAEQFFTRLQIEELLRLQEPSEIQPTALSLLALWRDSPTQLQQILTELSDGRFVLNVTVTETRRSVRAHNRRALLLVTAILSVGIA